MKIHDGFDFKQLECQYFMICKDYSPKYCHFDYHCDLRMEMRQIIESYIAAEALELMLSTLDE